MIAGFLGSPFFNKLPERNMSEYFDTFANVKLTRLIFQPIYLYTIFITIKYVEVRK